ncbi:hypothetical protein RHGRI_014629 [Rhododendron griersonianum]|uniref:Ankyrin repeat family protein n=1 Tax=Rhododendron griersonianum TaxID=479676 RepID=A0AAV6KA31_9ERIC|nr:hypothetical protein RHGRI_014629 [Rhododendron griersonianum]
MDQQVPQNSSSETQNNVAADTIEPENNNLEDVKDEYWKYIPLFKAALRGDWDAATRFFVQDESAITAPISQSSETALHIAVGTGERAIHFVKKLVELMLVEALTLRETYGDTALHVAATVGNTRAAVVLVQKNPDLPYIRGYLNRLPLHCAALYACKDTLLFLLNVTKDDHVSRPFSNENAVRLVNYAINSGFYDVALNLVQRYPQVVKSTDQSKFSALEIIAKNASAFPSGTRLNFWQRIIYCYVPVKLETNVPIKDPLSRARGDLENPAAANRRSQVIVQKKSKIANHALEMPLIKHIREQKQIHLEALTLLKCVCKESRSLNDSNVFKFAKDALIVATRSGIHEVIEEIVDSYPQLIWTGDNDNHKLFQQAVIHRHENVFNFLYQMGDHKQYITMRRDKLDDTMLHLAGKLAPQRKLDLVPGAALQMQRELQWFKVRHLTF